jgi:hypothetical protein
MLVVRDLARGRRVQEAVQWDEARTHSANTGGRFLGPVLAKLFPGLSFALNFASDAQFLATVARDYKDLPAGKHKASETFREKLWGLRDGWLRVRHDPVLRAITLSFSLGNVASAVFSVRALTAVVSAPWWVTGPVVAAAGLGGVVGAAFRGGWRLAGL